jgi:hypothetical protein
MSWNAGGTEYDVYTYTVMIQREQTFRCFHTKAKKHGSSMNDENLSR